MKIAEWLRKKVCALVGNAQPPSNWRELDARERYMLAREFGCLVCAESADDMETNPDFMCYKGSVGGLSQNMWCAVCGTRWNFTEIPGLGLMDLVTERERPNIQQEEGG